MDFSFFDDEPQVKPDPDGPPPVDPSRGVPMEEGEWVPREELNPMQQLEKGAIQRQVDEMMMRLFNVPPASAQDDEQHDVLGEDNVKMEDPQTLINSTEVHLVNRQTNMIHEVVILAGKAPPALRMPSATPAHTFDFPLDNFQKAAIQVIENGQSLLVAAHTTAGKTAIAQYAIAEAVRNGKNVIYTSPVKALSNQKYRELEQMFDVSEIGLMTGDVSMNEKAAVQVMTTEILRNKLYNHHEYLANVEWVIFDEVHYMNDEARGVVWEESIILLPEHIRQIYLSATLPNAKQFAGWVCSLKKQPIHIISTEFRPVPIAHYVLPVGCQKLFQMVGQNGTFKEIKLAEAMSEMERGLEMEKREKKKAIKDQAMIDLTRTLAERDLLPCLAFSFARAECEHYATAIIKDIDLNTEAEKSRVRGIVEIAMDRLTDEDRKLSQIQHLLPLLERGTAVHHSGLIPVMKETIELLFNQGLVKMLFATETFAMGINAPARAVVFTSARKFDGKKNRWLTANEYAQMSGRAGRRNDMYVPTGCSVMMLDERIRASELKAIMLGTPEPMISRFKLSYSMLLNLMARREMPPEQMMDLSLRRYQNTMEIPELIREIDEKEATLARVKMPENMKSTIEEYLDLQNAIKRIGLTTKKMYMHLPNLLPFFHTGRLIKIKHAGIDFGWGLLIKFERKTNPDSTNEYVYMLEVLIHVDAASVRDFNNTGVLKPAGKEGKTSWEIVPMVTNCIDEISTTRFFVPEDLNGVEAKERLGDLVEGFVMERMLGTPTLLDPIKDMEIRNPALEEALDKMRAYQRDLNNHPLEKMKRGSSQEMERFEELTKAHTEKANTEQELKRLRQELRKKKIDIREGTELFRRKEVLFRLGYIEGNDILKKKGRAAACISTGDELMLTELIADVHLEQIEGNDYLAALLSCFVCDEQSVGKLSSNHMELYKRVQEYARKVARHIINTGQELDENEYVESFKPSLMEVTRQWVNGAEFATLLKATDLYEGTIIRSLRRLEELLKELSVAAGVAGKEVLQDRFDDIRTKIRRNIVFTASLYL